MSVLRAQPRRPLFNGGAQPPGQKRSALRGRPFNGGARAPSAGPKAGFNIPKPGQGEGAVFRPGDPAPGARAPAATPADPRDATYWDTVTRLDASANDSRRQVGEQSAFERTALLEAVRRLHDAQPVNEQRATNRANAQGLLYSGTLGQQIGDLRTDALRRETDAQGSFDRREAGRAQQLGAIDSRLIDQKNTAFADAVARAAERDADAPLVAPPLPATGRRAPRPAARRPTPAARRPTPAHARRPAARPQARARRGR